MENNKVKRIVVKLVILVIIGIIGSIISRAVEPLVTADISIQAQLADSDASAASYSIYKDLLGYHWVLYLLIALIMFWGDIFGKKKKDKN